jgi:tetratricopeptide (TPR) repeat protein
MFQRALDEIEIVSKADQLERGAAAALEYQIVKARIYHYLGDAARAWKEFQQFATYIDTLRPSVPRSGRAPLTRTALAMSVGETKVAEEFLDSMAVDAAKDTIETAAYRRARAYYFMLKPDLEKSLADFQYVAQQRVNFSASYELGRAYLLLGRFQEAADAFEKVRNSYFDEARFSTYIHNVLYYYYLGRAYEGLGKTDQAIKDYSTFIEIWKDADSPIEDLKDAQKRLAALKARV